MALCSFVSLWACTDVVGMVGLDKIHKVSGGTWTPRGVVQVTEVFASACCGCFVVTVWTK